MATVDALYQVGAGQNLVTLAGTITADAQFDVQPVATDQIVYPDGVTVDAQLNISGPDGAYTLYHVQNNGVTAAQSYSIVTEKASVNAALTAPAGFSVVTLAGSVKANSRFATQPVAGDQIAYPDGLVCDAQLNISAPVGTHSLYHIQQDGSWVQTDYEVQAASTTASLTMPAEYTIAALEAGFDPYAFQKWTAQPQVGWQLVTVTASGYFDSHGDYWNPQGIEQPHDVWVIDLSGAVTHIIYDSSGLDTYDPTDRTPDQFSFTPLVGQQLGEEVVFNEITITGVDAGADVPASIAGGKYAVDAGSGYGGFTTANTNVQLGYKVLVAHETSTSFATEKTGTFTAGGVSADFSSTTRAAILPVLDAPLPDLSLSKPEAVSIDLDQHFSRAASYTVSGFPAGSGLALVERAIAGTTNSSDEAASPFTLTVTAHSADGSTQDSFGLTVVEYIAPVISINSITTKNTAPIVSGSAGDAVSLSLVVDGVTYNPAPSNGMWVQQLPSLPLNTYVMTLNGQDAAGNAAVERRALLKIVSEIPATIDGLFRSPFKNITAPASNSLFR